MRMDCAIHCNDYGFKVGRKYLHLTEIYTDKTLEKIPLYPIIIGRLKAIKEKYGPYDVNRTLQVMYLFNEFEDLVI